ncbi:MAG: DUF6444 domain-containing protein [Pirellulaceae bacterium]
MTTTTDPHTPTYDELVATVETLQARMAELEAEWAKARKDSATSSRPPSSDTVKPKPGNKKRGRPKKRKQGGQPGHPRHERQCFDESEIDKYIDDYLDEHLLHWLPDEDPLNVDETGHENSGKHMWTWCFRASLDTLFRID